MVLPPNRVGPPIRVTQPKHSLFLGHEPPTKYHVHAALLELTHRIFGPYSRMPEVSIVTFRGIEAAVTLTSGDPGQVGSVNGGHGA